MLLKQFTQEYGIAITGGIATGKSSLTNILKSWGYYCLDADQLAREVVLPGSPAFKKIVREFGERVLKGDGSLDRTRLRELVFEDSRKRELLESITHPEIRNLMEKKLRKEGLLQVPRVWFYEAALIFEAGLAKDFREVWLLVANPQIQATRLQKRDFISSKEAVNIMKAQWPDEKKKKLADVVIENHGDIDSLSKGLRMAVDAMKERLGLGNP